MFILGPFLFLSLNIFAQFNKATTGFSWVEDSETKYKGQCYEYDLETGGQKFQVKVRKLKCKPSETTFIWIEKSGGIGGKCYEVDTETKGSKYSSRANREDCLTGTKSYVFIQSSELKGTCYQVVNESNKVKVKTDLCKTGDVSFHWLPNSSGWGGKCYEVDSVDGPSSYINKVNGKQCRPLNTSYVLKTSKTDLSGDCYEVDSENGKEGYSFKVARSKCLDTKKEKKYVWQQIDQFQGKCLEFQETINGSEAIKATDYKKCITFETKIEFIRISPTKGYCVEMDKNTSGRDFTTKLNLSICKALAKKTEIVSMDIKKGKKNCFEVDSKTQGNQYIKRVSSSECDEVEVFPKWVSDETGWRGKCRQVLSNGKFYKNSSFYPEKCRPKKTKKMWHNFEKLKGACFEIDSEKGPEYYSVQLESKECRPKFIKYIFYRKKGDDAGRCYAVDDKTGGSLYNKKVGARNCKRKLNAPAVD